MPLAPVSAADRLGPGAPGRLVPGFGRQQRRRPSPQSAASSITGVTGPVTSCCRSAASARRVTLGFHRFPAPPGRRPSRSGAAPPLRKAWRAAVLAFSAVSSAVSKCASARPIFSKANPSASTSQRQCRFDADRRCRSWRDRRPAPAASMPSSRKARSDSEPTRLDSTSPPAATNRAKWAKSRHRRTQRLENLDLRRACW